MALEDTAVRTIATGDAVIVLLTIRLLSQAAAEASARVRYLGRVGHKQL